MALGKWPHGFQVNMDILQKYILEYQPGTCQDLFEDMPHLHEEESGNQEL